MPILKTIIIIVNFFFFLLRRIIVVINLIESFFYFFLFNNLWEKKFLNSKRIDKKYLFVMISRFMNKIGMKKRYANLIVVA